MTERNADAQALESSASERTPRIRPRHCRRFVPWKDDILERRELLSTFPLTGTFTGNYDTRAALNGIGQGQEVSGTISVSITVNSIQNEGGGIYQADVTGTVTVTGFLQPTATYPFSGENGLETGYGLRIAIDGRGEHPGVQRGLAPQFRVDRGERLDELDQRELQHRPE